MSFSLIRRKSRLIYIVTSIILIPAFILLYGDHAPGNARQGDDDPEIARLDGKPVYQSEERRFQEHMSKVLGRPYGLRYLPQGIASLGGRDNYALARLLGYRQQLGYGTSAVDFIISRLALKDAEAAGLAVSPAEVGNFIRTSFFQEQFLDDESGKFSENKYQKFVKEQLRMTTRDYQETVRQWLLIKRFYTLINRTSLSSWETAYQAYAQGKAEFRYYKMHVRVTDKMKDQVLDTLRGVSKELPKGDDKLVIPAVERYINKHQGDADRKFWQKPKWRFEYVFAALENPATATTEPISEARLKKYFDDNKASKYDKKKLVDIRKQVLKDLTASRQDSAARRLIARTFETRLNKMMSQVKEEKVPLEALLNDRILKQRGIAGAVSAPQAQTLEALRDNPAFGGSEHLAWYLDTIDYAMRNTTDTTKRAEILKKKQKDFDNERSPMSSKKGYFRVRILEYIPGEKRTLTDAKGIVDQGLRLEVVVELQKEGALKLAREAAVKYGEQLKAGKTKGISDLELLTRNFFMVDRFIPALRDAEMQEPLILPKGGGYDVLLLVERKVPSRADFDRLALAQRLTAMQTACATTGHFSFRGPALPNNYRYSAIPPGPRFCQWMSHAFRTRVTIVSRPKEKE